MKASSPGPAMPFSITASAFAATFICALSPLCSQAAPACLREDFRSWHDCAVPCAASPGAVAAPAQLAVEHRRDGAAYSPAAQRSLEVTVIVRPWLEDDTRGARSTTS